MVGSGHPGPDLANKCWVPHVHPTCPSSCPSSRFLFVSSQVLLAVVMFRNAALRSDWVLGVTTQYRVRDSTFRLAVWLRSVKACQFRKMYENKGTIPAKIHSYAHQFELGQCCPPQYSRNHSQAEPAPCSRMMRRTCCSMHGLTQRGSTRGQRHAPSSTTRCNRWSKEKQRLFLWACFIRGRGLFLLICSIRN